MIGLDVQQFREYVVTVALKQLQLWTPAAENLVLGTALHESGGLRFLDQATPGPGPAYGPWQMEAPTFNDIWANFIPRFPFLRNRLQAMACGPPNGLPPDVATLHGNLFLGAAMCRIAYYRVPQPLPGPTDALGMAQYWKAHYNTPLGKGTVDEALPAFKLACGT